MGGVPGSGLAKGLAVTLGTMTHRSHTQQYPDVPPDLPPRSRGVIALLEENCTVCMLCARECPDWCIYIDSHKEEVQIPGAARPRQRNVLDRFAIDFSLCMYCGICIEVCPFDALFWSPEFEYAEYDIRELLHEKEHLGEWMATVPSPPAHDPNGEPAKVEQAAARATPDGHGPAARATPDGHGPAARATSKEQGPAARPGPGGPGDRPRPARGDQATPRPSRGESAAPDQARGRAATPSQGPGEAAGPPSVAGPEGGVG